MMQPYLITVGSIVTGVNYEDIESQKRSDRLYVSNELAKIVEERLGIEQIVTCEEGLKFTAMNVSN